MKRPCSAESGTDHLCKDRRAFGRCVSLFGCCRDLTIVPSGGARFDEDVVIEFSLTAESHTLSLSAVLTSGAHFLQLVVKGSAYILLIFFSPFDHRTPSEAHPSECGPREGGVPERRVLAAAPYHPGGQVRQFLPPAPASAADQLCRLYAREKSLQVRPPHQ